MDLIQIDDHGRLFLSPDVDDWKLLEDANISAIIDLDGGLDVGMPTVPNHLIYLHFPFDDAHVPNLSKLHAVAQFGAQLIRQEHHVLSHCGLGFNRSALVAGLILRYLGMTGLGAVELLRRKRPGALYNETYAQFLVTCEIEL